MKSLTASSPSIFSFSLLKHLNLGIFTQFFLSITPILKKRAPQSLRKGSFSHPRTPQIPTLSFHSVLSLLHFQAPAPQVSEGPALPYTAVYLSYGAASPLFDYESSTATLALASSHILPICGRCGFCPIAVLKSFLKGHLFVRSSARRSCPYPLQCFLLFTSFLRVIICI